MKKLLCFLIALFCCANTVFAQQKNHDELRSKLKAITSKYKATVGFSVIQFETGDTISMNNQLHFPMQSVYKFPLAMAILNEVDKGKLSLQQEVFIDKKMRSYFTYSPMKKKYAGDSLRLTIAELLYNAVSWSDNLSCDVLFKVMNGPKAVNSFIHKQGFKNIEIAYTEQEMGENPLRMYKNYCKPYTMTLMLKKFFEKKMLSDSSTKFLMNLMTNTFNSPARLKGNLLPQIVVAHKTGTGNIDSSRNAYNDVGIITMPDGTHLAVSVFVMNSSEKPATTEHIIAQIGFEIFNEFNKNQPIISIIENEIGNNPGAGKYITLNGAKHYYEVYGEGKPLLLIHGNSTPTRGWASQIQFFKKKYKVYSIDCRGRGKSELGDDSLTYVQQAKDIAEFMDKLQLDSVNIVGKSDGGIIGILLGINFPKRIKKIVAFGANMQPDTTALYAESVKEIRDERIKADKMLAAKNATKNWLIEQQRYRMMEYQPHITADDLHKIKVPVLVMSTDRDLIKEEHTFFIYKNIPFASLSILSGESHHVAKQNPDLFNATVDKFLTENFKGNKFRFKQ
jgi:beta-lactamase class A/pimeloyl-ACP methyl ester carboxylesterase